MSILKDLNQCNGVGQGPVGLSRKSVSFCHRDNVHVYKCEPYYEDEEENVDISSLSSNFQTSCMILIWPLQSFFKF